MPEATAQAPSLSLTAEPTWPVDDRDRIDRDLAAFLADARRLAAGSAAEPLLARAAAFVLRGGKRLRPRLCLASYRILAAVGDDAPRPVRLAAASLELFHAFMLVHDDLIDGSLTRRGLPTLHEALRDDRDPEAAKRAADLGVVAGDLLFALGMRLLARAGLPAEAQARAQALMADVLLETGLGQALDILQDRAPLDRLGEPEIVAAYVRKTARYTVSGPLALGAALAGAPTAVNRALVRFGERLGLAYQLRNDLDALDAADPDAPCPDLDAGKRTLVLWQAYQLLPEAGRRALADALDAPVGPDRRRALIALIHDSGAPEACRDRLRLLHLDALDALRGPRFDPDRRRRFAALAALLPHHGPGPGLSGIG